MNGIESVSYEGFGAVVGQQLLLVVRVQRNYLGVEILEN